MNIFLLDKNPEKCAVYHCDKHVVKMILESAQMLCTAHWLSRGLVNPSESISKTCLPLERKNKSVQAPTKLGFRRAPARNSRFARQKLVNSEEKFMPVPYKPTHIKHPCNLWLLESLDNYEFLCNLGLALCREYTYRYGKVHKSQAVIEWCAANKPAIKRKGLTPFALAMPEEYKEDDSVNAYRNYYIGEKKSFARYTKRDVPGWLKN